MDIYTPYTYLIGWSKLNKWYYGAKYGRGAHPNNFWKTYFTTSNAVKDYVKVHGQPDVIQIRKTFLSEKSCIDWESTVLKRIYAAQDSKFLNGHNAKGFISYKTEEHCRNIGKARSKKRKGRDLEATRQNAKKGTAARIGQKDSQQVKEKRAASVRKTVNAEGYERKYKYTLYMIDDKEFVGIPMIVEKYKITRQAIHYRIKSKNFNWHIAGSVVL
tara:strand:+ start:132 stop:779 length:648 start_codon:yes stop_codon:yes gene_type:complete